MDTKIYINGPGHINKMAAMPIYGKTFKILLLQGPVVQSIVSLTTSLRRQFVKYMPTTLSNTQLFVVEKM